jgi:hypothetical protein
MVSLGDETNLVLLLTLFAASISLGYYIFVARHQCEKDAMDACLTETEAYRKRIVNGIVEIGRFDILSSVALSIMTFISNVFTVAHLLDLAHGGDKTAGAMMLTVRLLNALAALTVLRAALFMPWLSTYLNGSLLHRGTSP